MLKTLVAVSAATTVLVCGSAAAQQKWDMPTGYPSNNFHTENIVQFAAEVDKATAAKLKITVHDNGSLFKANEIKRAVQGVTPIRSLLTYTSAPDGSLSKWTVVAHPTRDTANRPKTSARRAPRFAILSFLLFIQHISFRTLFCILIYST